MESPEVPIENVQEHIHEHARHAPDRFNMGVALSTALLAALAAIASLLAGSQANEAMALQIESSDTWAFYQAKSIKSVILTTKNELLIAVGKAPNEKDVKKLSEYEAGKNDLEYEAKTKQGEAHVHLARHETLSLSVTFFQLAIALSAITILTKMRFFWLGSLILGLVGLIYLSVASIQLLAAKHHRVNESASETALGQQGKTGEHTESIKAISH